MLPPSHPAAPQNWETRAKSSTIPAGLGPASVPVPDLGPGELAAASRKHVLHLARAKRW